jgi:hypothetical protein
MPDKIWKPKVKKEGIIKLETIKPTGEKVVVVKRKTKANKAAKGAKKTKIK